MEMVEVEGFEVVGEWYVKANYAKRYHKLRISNPAAADLFLRQVRVEPKVLVVPKVEAKLPFKREVTTPRQDEAAKMALIKVLMESE